MDYVAKSVYQGDKTAAFDLAITALTALGFRLRRKSPDSCEMTGPGMISARQSPLLGASIIRISAIADQLELAAQLGGVDRMVRFVKVFPVALNLLLAVVLMTLFGFLFGGGAPVWGVAMVGGANALVWLVLGPMMARNIRARTCRGLDTLLTHLVAAAADEA